MPRRMWAGKADRVQLGDVRVASVFRPMRRSDCLVWGKHCAKLPDRRQRLHWDAEGLSDGPIMDHAAGFQMLVPAVCPYCFAQGVPPGAPCVCKTVQRTGWRGAMSC